MRAVDLHASGFCAEPAAKADGSLTVLSNTVGIFPQYLERLGPLTTTTRREDQPKMRIDYLLTFGDVEATSTIVDPAGPRIADHLAVFGTIALK